MHRSRYQNQRLFGSRDSIDRRVDKWIETGRQVVDGVAGNRPGMRRGYSSRLSGANFEKVGRWVGDKLDWFLEDEDGWLEPWQEEAQGSHPRNKRPLEAVSLRVQKQIDASSKNPQKIADEGEWPEESSFRVERWQRNDPATQNSDSERQPIRRKDTIKPERRPLPRSSRRR